MQSNKLIVPFRNKGWSYMEKIQDIIPNASARGRQAFSAMHTAPPNAMDQTIDLDGLDSPSGPFDHPQIPDNDAIKNIADLMDIDNEAESSTAISASSKRKFDISASIDTSSVEPAMKKSSNTSPSIGSSSLSFTKTSSEPPSSKGPPSSTKSGRPSRRVPSSSKQTSSKITPALLVHEMQGTIGTLAAAVRDAGATDPVAKLRQEAIEQVSKRDDGLSSSEKLMIIKMFARDYASVQTYLGLTSIDDLRKAWLAETIEELRNL
jgi:tellurite resistance protein